MFEVVKHVVRDRDVPPVPDEHFWDRRGDLSGHARLDRLGIEFEVLDAGPAGAEGAVAAEDAAIDPGIGLVGRVVVEGDHALVVELEVAIPHCHPRALACRSSEADRALRPAQVDVAAPDGVPDAALGGDFAGVQIVEHVSAATRQPHAALELAGVERDTRRIGSQVHLPGRHHVDDAVRQPRQVQDARVAEAEAGDQHVGDGFWRLHGRREPLGGADQAGVVSMPFAKQGDAAAQHERRLDEIRSDRKEDHASSRGAVDQLLDHRGIVNAAVADRAAALHVDDGVAAGPALHGVDLLHLIRPQGGRRHRRKAAVHSAEGVVRARGMVIGERLGGNGEPIAHQRHVRASLKLEILPGPRRRSEERIVPEGCMPRLLQEDIGLEVVLEPVVAIGRDGGAGEREPALGIGAED